MILLNLASPEWLTVNCSSKYFIDIVCMKRNESTQNNVSFYPFNMYCSDNNIMKGTSCYQFHYFDGRYMSLDAVDLQFGLDAMVEIQFILLAVKVTFPPILKLQGPFIKHTFYNKYHNVLIPNSHFSPEEKSNGYFVTKTKNNKMSDDFIHLIVHKCRSGGIIAIHFLCDENFDCGADDTSDEDNCICKDTDEVKMKMCKYVCGADSTCKPSFLFNKPNHIDSPHDKSENHKTHQNQTINFICSSGYFIDIMLVDDLVPDCEGGDDEEKLFNLLRSGKIYTCPKPDQIPCRKGHSRCFNVNDICIYKLNKYKHIVPCRTGEHMEECKTFECNKKFKCPDYYCIPFAYHCDGKWDCPDGVDESVTNCVKWRMCKNLFHCRNSQICTHIDDVCDSVPDCPLKDDEMHCQNIEVNCPRECLCHVFSIQCYYKIFNKKTALKFPFLYVKISQANVETLNFINFFLKIIWLHVPQNRIVFVCNFLSFNNSLIGFDASNNKVTRLTKHCFHKITGLRIMNLQNNSIQEIHDDAFTFLPILDVVNLSNNLINEIESSLLKHTLLLDLVNNPLLLLNARTFHLSKVQIILTNDYHVCCIAPSVIKCNALKPWYISCSKLLPSKTMSIILLVVVLFIFVLNIFSIIGQLIFKDMHAFNMIIISVNISDLVYGILMAILLISDYVYHENFVTVERMWRSSIPCYIIFIFSVLFSVMSTSSLFFISVCRLIAVTLPFCLKIKNKYFIGKIMMILVIFILVTSIVIGIIFKETEKYLPTSLCSPFIDPSNSIFLIKVITISIGILQLVTSALICLIYSILVKDLRKTEETFNKSVSLNNFNLIIQILIVTSSNLICWIPSNIIYISTLFMSKYPTDLLIWTTISVTPINSIINPLVFVVSTIKAMN